MQPWRIVALTAVTAALGLAALGFTVDSRGVAVTVCATLLCEALALYYRAVRPDPRLSASLTAVAQVVVFSAVAGPLSYVAAALGGQLWDATFARWDRCLGVDWLGYAAFVEGHPLFALAGGVAYDSFKLQILLVLLVLGFTGRTRALAEFVVAFALSGAAVVLLSGLMPALGAYPGLGVPPGRFPLIAPRDVYDTAATVVELRRGGARSLSLSDLYGIISFPSFHAAGAVLFCAALWRIPVLRWPAAAWEALMAAATPTHGGHYVVDVLAGGATAATALVVARAAGRTREAPEPARPEVRAHGVLRA